MKRLLATFIGMSFISVLLPFVPVQASACCICGQADNPKKTACITNTAGACADLKTSKNTAAQALVNCTEIDPTQCKIVAQNGICLAAPVDELQYTAPSKTTQSASPNLVTLTQPSLGVPIPGVDFASSAVVDSSGKIAIPFLAQYISAIYRYLIGLSAIAAAVMIVYGGFLYIVGSSGVKVSQGKDIIKDALVGMALVLGAYLILNTVNPDTINLNTLRVYSVTPSVPNVETIAAPAYSQILASASSETPSGGEPPTPPQSAAPGSKYKNGSCEFDLNQAGIPTVLSIYHCAMDIISKELNVNGCYLFTAMNNESLIAMPNSLSHDENALGKPKSMDLDIFPQRKLFIDSGVTFKGKQITDPDHQLNDDNVDLTKDDLGLDPRFSHGGGLTQYTYSSKNPVKNIYGERMTIKQLFEPYYGIRAGGLHIQNTLKQGSAFDTQKLPGTISMVWILYGGCYNKNGTAGKCPAYDKNATFNVTKPKTLGNNTNRLGEAYWCMQDENPYAWINPSFFTICRGDLPLDRDACKAYVDSVITPIVPTVSSARACGATFCDGRLPVKCSTKGCVLR